MRLRVEINVATRWLSGLSESSSSSRGRPLGVGEVAENEDDEYFDLLPNI